MTDLPQKCFISYSYKDSKECEKLISALSETIEPYTFPPIDVTPDQLVSNELISAILERDGLVFLDGGYSSESFWVAFERDYALRAGKKVFSASIDANSIQSYKESPLDLATCASYHRDDRDKVREIAQHLKDERYFDIWIDGDEIEPGKQFAQEIESSINDRVSRGGYVVVFWSAAAAESKFVENELASAVAGMVDENDRVLFGLLDDTPVPEFWQTHNKSTVQLFGDDDRSFINRIDDLVVQLYWLIYKNTRYKNI